MKSPIARSTPAAPSMFTESLVTTLPPRKRVRGAMLAAAGAHLLVGAGLYTSTLVRFEALEKPAIAAHWQPPVIDVMIRPVEHHAARKGSEDASGGGKPREGKVPPPAEAPRVPPAVPAEPAKESEEKPEVLAQPSDGKGDPRDGAGEYNPDGKHPGDRGTPDGKGTEDTGHDTVSSISNEYALSEPPVAKLRVDPVYPEMARQQGLSGLVILEIVIDEQGRVIATRIVRTDNVIFNRAAEDAVRQWKFTTPKNDGRAVRTYKTVTMKFQLH